ncbi:MAG: RnfABCDGE type electron transport complex subunit B [Clostridia bacterium]|nr:RnfABCDGE type electron transport complex subunit B [Clostridia bacterium]
MEISMILIPAAILAALGAFFGILLAIASRAFAVKVDERVPLVRDALPGANCGGCGYSGCDALAAAIVEGKAPCGACTVGGDAAAQRIGAIMGVTVEKKQRMRAQVMCSGGDAHATKKYAYEGAQDCLAAARLAGGDKLCPYGCIGLGSCASVCPFDAIHVENGVAAVDYRKCEGCGSCVAICPKSLIRLIPYDSAHWVGCMSQEKGGTVTKQCKVGCIGCTMCQRVCEAGAVTVKNALAEIDYTKCVNCGKCVEKCSRKIIWSAERQEGGLFIHRL